MHETRTVTIQNKKTPPAATVVNENEKNGGDRPLEDLNRIFVEVFSSLL